MEKQKYERARKRVEEIKGFYIHAVIYVIVNLGMFIFNYFIIGGNLWFFWSLFGWGMGLAAHGLGVFGLGGIWGKDWEERKIRELMEKDRQKENL